MNAPCFLLERNTYKSSHRGPTLGCVVAEFTIATLPSSSVARRMCVTKSRGRHGQTPIVALQEILLSLSITSKSLPSSTRGLYCGCKGVSRDSCGSAAIKFNQGELRLEPSLALVIENNKPAIILYQYDPCQSPHTEATPRTSLVLESISSNTS